MTTIKTPKELREEALLFRLWSYFIECGIPLLDAVRRLAGMFPNFGAPLSAIGVGVKRGEDMRTSFAGQEKSFSECVPEIVDFGANSGALQEALWGVSMYLQGTRNLVLAGAPLEKICEVNFYRLNSVYESLGATPILAFKYAGKVFLPDKVIAHVSGEVEAGHMLYDGLVRYPQLFSEDDLRAIYRGELSGRFGDEARSLAESKEEKLLANAQAVQQPPSVSEVPEVISELTLLSTMVDSGVSLAEGLNDLAGRASSVRSCELALLSQMMHGRLFSQVLLSEPNFFPSEIVPIIQAGEMGGKLETGLVLVVRYLRWKMLDAD